MINLIRSLAIFCCMYFVPVEGCVGVFSRLPLMSLITSLLWFLGVVLLSRIMYCGVWACCGRFLLLSRVTSYVVNRLSCGLWVWSPL